MKYTVTINGTWSGNCYDVEADSEEGAIEKCQDFGPEQVDEVTIWENEEIEVELDTEEGE